ncbi:chorismate-binding protein [Corynebacterium pseudopelargi]|uniref:aminodeoxychorismate synthase n=1 Tax=Corynebacterium pseudopelargi TaxID=2080757 RepID=A0A3G6IWT7_9CORY|nr:chorismate-binding protein [Corynebacterium pseudopelargi]AZA10235.1 Aminodeoxychorismate synthase component 1 [Corynebacterium pseudopelargi]
MSVPTTSPKSKPQGLRIVVVDNGDSYTQILAASCQRAIGVAPQVVDADLDIPIPEADVFVIGPGPGHPSQVGSLARRIVHSTTPVIGICLGHQLLAYEYGATVAPAKNPSHGLVSTVSHCQEDVFSAVPSPLEVMRYHSLDVTDLPSCLLPLATAEDGSNMALRHATKPQWGVQFHPESIGTPNGVLLLRNLLLHALELRSWAKQPYFAWLEFEGNTTIACASGIGVGDTLIGACTYEATGGKDAGAWHKDQIVGFRPEKMVQFSGTLPEIPGKATSHGKVRIRHSREQYRSLVRRCQEFIRTGDSYELCLTTEASVEVEDPDPLEMYLRARGGAMNGLLITPEVTLISASPELFLRCRNGTITTLPMKGTRPRASNAEEDAALREELRTSTKDRAENMMVTDVLRNDLTRSCDPLSVEVTRLCEVMSYPQWHQMISEISGSLNVDPLEALRLAFPGGSMTGAPKQRSMDILRELEGRPRGWYSGAMGIVQGENATFSMLIRTAVLRGSTLTYGAGGAITQLSDPDEEYDEVLAKLSALYRML